MLLVAKPKKEMMMAAKTYELEFKGYWRDENKGGLPNSSGVYCVYICTFDSQSSTVWLKELIYIGEAGNIRERVANHEKYNQWKKHLTAGQQLCFSASEAASADRERCEAALIFKHKPPENDEYKNSFPFDTTTMKLSGATELLSTYFTVYRT